MKHLSIFTLILAAALILTGCTTSTNTPQASVPTSAPVATSMPAPTTLPVATSLPNPTNAPAPTAEPTTAPALQIELGQNSEVGSFLVDDQGMTLYLYTKDTPNTSNCYDQCATAWPPLVTSAGMAAAGAGVDDSKISTTNRTDGSIQVTYNGWPLYYYAKDAKPGDFLGQNVGGVWFMLSADGMGIGMGQTAPLSGDDNSNSNTNDNTNSADNDNSNENSNGNDNGNTNGDY